MNIERQDGGVVITLGRMFMLRAADQLRAEISELMDTGVKKISINFSTTEYVDSSGLGALVDINRELKEINGECIIVGLKGHCRELFINQKLDHEITLQESLS